MHLTFARFPLTRTPAILMSAILMSLTLIAPATAQDGSDDPVELLKDFVHYVNVARPDLARAYGESLIETGITNQELAVLVDEGDPERFDAAIERALLQSEMEDVAAELSERAEQGRLDLARDGDRIDQAIQMLVGTQRQKLLAVDRLKAAGEYAVPALLVVITDGKNERLKLACQKMIREIGLPAVSPLTTALPSLHPQNQRTVSELLGDLGYPHAGPALLDLSTLTADPAVRSAAETALHNIGIPIGGGAEDVSRLYGELARGYYDAAESLIPYPFDPTNNVWSYDDFVGLEPTPVPTEVFNEIMTMKTAARGLELSSTNRDALALYVAANLKRENDLPSDADDPIFGDADVSPAFYATVFGTDVCQDVLALALDSTDTPLVRDAIDALAKTTGGANLFADSGRRPLIDALAYPDRRVQYEAALTLARALPEVAFDGSFRVVPTLASAVRTGGQTFAIVLSDDDENRRQAVIDVENAGFTVLGAETNVASMNDVLIEASGIDLIVVRMRTADGTVQTIGDLRSVVKTQAAPVLVLAPGLDMGSLRRQYIADERVSIAHITIDQSGFLNAVDALLDRAAGGRMTESEAEAYAFEALSALEDVSISASPAYDILDAESALLDALETRTGRARLLVAGIIARIDTDRAQQHLFETALDATGGERIDLLERVAESVKRFGDRARPDHVAGLLDLVTNSTGSTAEAAARVHGALNIQDSDAVRLIR